MLIAKILLLAFDEKVRDIHEAGANIIVAGSAVFKGNAADNVKKLIELM